MPDPNYEGVCVVLQKPTPQGSQNTILEAGDTPAACYWHVPLCAALLPIGRQIPRPGTGTQRSRCSEGDRSHAGGTLLAALGKKAGHLASIIAGPRLSGVLVASSGRRSSVYGRFRRGLFLACSPSGAELKTCLTDFEIGGQWSERRGPAGRRGSDQLSQRARGVSRMCGWLSRIICWS